MKPLLLIYCFLLPFAGSIAQVKLHAHNDYEKPQPLVNALHNKVFSVETDVFPVGKVLAVAHTKEQVDTNITLDKLYLQPIIKLFQQHHGYISDDTTYRLALMIDIKEKSETAIPLLIKLIEPWRQYFDRTINKAAVQLILSGDRGPVEQWTQYPGYIYFDGRPYENYDAATLQRVAVVSDNFIKYSFSNFSGDLSRLTSVINKVHAWNKPLRLWAAPDEEYAWQKLRELGVDIINTDKVGECNAFLNQKRF